MNQHPIPQNVTQYQFRLVGDMTLKQFLELASGLVMAWLFYASNLIFIFKWPLAILSIFFGVALAFFPLEERPLDVWITNFIKAIYAPTRFIWKKSYHVPNIFTFEKHALPKTQTSVKTVKAPTISSLKPKPVSDLSETEETKISALDALLNSTSGDSTPKVILDEEPPVVKPHKPSVKVRKLSSDPKIVFEAPVKIKKTPQPSNEIAKQLDNNPAIPSPTIHLEEKSKQQAVQAKSISLPAAPKQPNIVVGMVVDKEGKMVMNAIVQIVGDNGVPARAIKTNSLGEFYTSTPLSSGKYTIETEKDDLNFPPHSLSVNNQVISPLLIKAA